MEVIFFSIATIFSVFMVVGGSIRCYYVSRSPSILQSEVNILCEENAASNKIKKVGDMLL